jgi:hypothetical protein
VFSMGKLDWLGFYNRIQKTIRISVNYTNRNVYVNKRIVQNSVRIWSDQWYIEYTMAKIRSRGAVLRMKAQRQCPPEHLVHVSTRSAGWVKKHLLTSLSSFLILGPVAAQIIPAQKHSMFRARMSNLRKFIGKCDCFSTSARRVP